MTHERNVYLEDIPLDEAKSHFLAAITAANKAHPTTAETIPLTEALGRVTAAPVWAKRSAPHYHASAMDGYAVRAADTESATETRPLQLSIPEQAVPVNTGAPVPPEMNAVIMIEHVQHHADSISIVSPVAPWQHIRMMGEDMVATELVLPSNHTIRPVDLGAIAGCGHHTVDVRRKPRVVMIPTGSELVNTDTEPEPGQVIEYNSLVLSAQVTEWGGESHVLDIVPDEFEAINAALQAAIALQPDLILILSGSSAGSKDFTASVVRENGDLLVHGVAVRPGHPVIMGMVSDIPLIGVPGYPVSAALTGDIFIKPLLRLWLGQDKQPEAITQVTATITRKLLSPTGDDDFVRVSLTQVGERLLATPIGKGAGVITSLVRADGIAHIPRFSEGTNANSDVTVTLLRSQAEIEQSVLMMGSHDPMLDLLSQHMMNRYGVRLVSANVGSMGGLVALKRGEAHAAGVHLLDGETGQYNVGYVGRYLPENTYSLITFAEREQGLIVPTGNPKQITSLNDLTRVRYVNRQRGAGTRLLLDYELEQRGIRADDVDGYNREEYTHLAVAVAVKTGIADCGLGVRSAAIALDLDFVTVGWERYDIVIPAAHSDHPGVVRLVETLRSAAFISALGQQPGYQTALTGRVVST